MYKEILELEEYCNEIGVAVRKETLYDGYILRFNNSGDVIQHSGSYGCRCGCVEFGYTNHETIDFYATPLKAAKVFIFKHKDELNKVREGEKTINEKQSIS
jgi:hypothetical protein